MHIFDIDILSRFYLYLEDSFDNIYYGWFGFIIELE